MERRYRLGVIVVLVTVAASVPLAALVPEPAPSPAGQDLGIASLHLGPFRLTERSGATVTRNDLAGNVWVMSFLFTRCPSSCPRVAATMKGLQEDLRGTGVRLISLTVDPEHDRPDVLAAFARKVGADPERWWFLTGPKDDVYRLILEDFKLGVREADPEERRGGAEAVMHSTRLALVDRGNRVVGYFDADDRAAVTKLATRARRLDRAWVARLPAVNASLNGACTVLLAVGLTLVRAGRIRAHIASMAAAVAVSAVFLACYLLYHTMIGGGVPFQGRGPIRAAYFTVLISHVVLAAAVVPLVVLTLARALRGEFKKHARIASVTFPIWLYVSLTGVVVYLMLYQMPLPPSGVYEAN